MQINLAPTTGLIFGAVLIVFRNGISATLQNFFEKFPKYKDGVETFALSFQVRPMMVLILGEMIVGASFLGLILSIRG